MTKKLYLIKTQEDGFPENLIVEGEQLEEVLSNSLKIQFIRITGSSDNEKKRTWEEKGKCIPEMGCFRKDRFFELFDILKKSGESFRLKVYHENGIDYYTSLFCERRAIIL